MLWPRKKLPNLEQCQMSQNFTSSYLVVSFRAIVEVFLRTKVKRWSPRFQILVSSQNAEKGATDVVAPEETT